MVVLITRFIKNNIMRSIFYFFLAIIIVSCSKDRIIEIVPVVYSPEYWYKDSTAVERYDLDGNITDRTVSYNGVSTADTLVLNQGTSLFYHSYSEFSKGSELVFSIDSGIYEKAADSLFLFGSDTSRYLVVLSTDSSFHFENTQNFPFFSNKTINYYSSLRVDDGIVSFYNDIYLPIMFNGGDGKCMPCHGEGAGQSVFFQCEPAATAYNDLVTGATAEGINYINTETPEDGYLYHLISGTAEGESAIMPPQGNDNGSLSQEEIDIILEWIEQGALNN